jgi:hypothetical protein
MMTKQKKERERKQTVSQGLILNDGRDLTQNIVYPEILHA